MAIEKRPRTAAAAAATVVGAAAVGAKLAHDRRSAATADAAQAFRLAPGELVGDGMRRIARGQIDQAHAELTEPPRRKLPGGVHDARKHLKRLRASVRLARDAIGAETYARENTTFRDLGRSLAGTRDAEVLIETLNVVRESAGEELPADATVTLESQLREQRDRAVATLTQDDSTVGHVVDGLDAARVRTTTWTFDTDGFDALAPGLRRIYRRGREAMYEAKADPSDEHLHEWRKRSKDLWHSAQILEPAGRKRMKKLARRAHRLADALGDDHDLAELRRYAVAHPGCFDSAELQAALLAVIDRRRSTLQARAFKRGARIYRRGPKRFVRTVERRWREHATS